MGLGQLGDRMDIFFSFCSMFVIDAWLWNLSAKIECLNQLANWFD